MSTGRTVSQKIDGDLRRIWEGVDCAFPKPGELIEIRGHANLTMQDRRTFNLLMTNAWSRITLNVEHSIKKSDLRGEHRSNERLSNTIDRLMKELALEN